MAESTRDKLSREMTHWQALDNSGRRVPDWLPDVVRGASYLPLDLLGTPTDLGLLATNALGLTDPGKQYAGGGDWWVDLAARHGLVAPRTGAPAESAGRIVGQVAMPGVSPAEMGAYAKVLPFVLGTFGGMGAKTADTDALARALQMEDAGEAREAIRKATGWFRAPWDKKWRFEIDDSTAGVWGMPAEVANRKGAPLSGTAAKSIQEELRWQPMKIPDVIQNENFFAAYPNFANKNAVVANLPGRNGEMASMTMLLSDSLDPGSARSVALHELQHGAQAFEGFARGGSPESVEPFLKNQAYALRQKAWEKFDEELKGVEGARGQGLALEKEARRLEDLATIAEYAPHHMYQRLAGEAEARLVQARRDLTPELRGLLDPVEQMDTMLKQEGFAGGINDLIVRYGDGPAMSAPKVERYAGEIAYRADPDEYVYHVTTAPKAKRILEKGFDPKAAKTVKGGFYENYSKGKVFFTDKDGLGFWRDRIEEHLEQAMDNPPELTVLRVKKSDLPGLKADDVGTKDARAGSWYLDAAGLKAPDQRAMSLPDELGAGAPEWRKAQ